MTGVVVDMSPGDAVASIASLMADHMGAINAMLAWASRFTTPPPTLQDHRSQVLRLWIGMGCSEPDRWFTYADGEFKESPEEVALVGYDDEGHVVTIFERDGSVRAAEIGAVLRRSHSMREIVSLLFVLPDGRCLDTIRDATCTVTGPHVEHAATVDGREVRWTDTETVADCFGTDAWLGMRTGAASVDAP